MTTDASQEELQAGRGYETVFVPALFASWPKYLIDGAEIHTSDHVLDIACGTGVLTRAVLARTGRAGRVVGLDPAPGMIAAAKEAEPAIEWVLRGAEDLPFNGNVFDRVVSQFGLMFFKDRPKAASEMHRVLKPGGKLAVAAWRDIDCNPAYGDIVAVLDEQVSTAAGDAVRLPFCLGDPDQVGELLLQAGFENIAFQTKSEQAKFPTPQTMIEVELRGWLPLFGIHLSEEKIADVLNIAGKKLAKYADTTGQAVFPTTAYIMTANKPDI